MLEQAQRTGKMARIKCRKVLRTPSGPHCPSSACSSTFPSKSSESSKCSTSFCFSYACLRRLAAPPVAVRCRTRTYSAPSICPGSSWSCCVPLRRQWNHPWVVGLLASALLRPAAAAVAPPRWPSSWIAAWPASGPGSSRDLCKIILNKFKPLLYMYVRYRTFVIFKVFYSKFATFTHF